MYDINTILALSKAFDTHSVEKFTLNFDEFLCSIEHPVSTDLQRLIDNTIEFLYEVSQEGYRAGYDDGWKDCKADVY